MLRGILLLCQPFFFKKSYSNATKNFIQANNDNTNLIQCFVFTHSTEGNYTTTSDNYMHRHCELDSRIHMLINASDKKVNLDE